ncbi:MAG: nucleoside hydrolase [Acidimicrobiales bacterium]
MPRVPMLIDCDPGLDDAIAILTAAEVADLVGITTVNGNVGIDHTTHNVGDHPDRPHRRRSTGVQPNHSPQSHSRRRLRSCGPTGLGTVQLPTLRRAEAASTRRSSSSTPAGPSTASTSWPIGPLTNIALALQLDPSLPERLGELTIMGAPPQGQRDRRRRIQHLGGSGGSRHRLPARWADDDGRPRRHPPGTPRPRNRTGYASRAAIAVMAADLLDYAVERSRATSAGGRAHPSHDACAVLAVTHPNLFGGSLHPVGVELTGTLTRGMTVSSTTAAVRPSVKATSPCCGTSTPEPSWTASSTLSSGSGRPGPSMPDRLVFTFALVWIGLILVCFRARLAGNPNRGGFRPRGDHRHGIERHAEPSGAGAARPTSQPCATLPGAAAWRVEPSPQVDANRRTWSRRSTIPYRACLIQRALATSHEVETTDQSATE